MCHHHEGRELADLRERIEVAGAEDEEPEPAGEGPEERLPPIQPS